MRDHEEDFASLLGYYLVRMGLTQRELANKIGMHRNTIVKWINRTSWPTSRGQVLRLADELSLTKQERRDFIQAAGFPLEWWWPTEVWTVPQKRDMFFTGRDEVLQSLRQLLDPEITNALTQAVSGLGGIGKTHTAIEYAYLFHEDYDAVLWLSADSWEDLVSACIQLADILELPEQKEASQVVVEVQKWLRKHRRWLLILDNLEKPQEILSRFLPSVQHGHIIITTRVHNIEPLAQTQYLSTMSSQEGILFLLRRTKTIDTAASLENANTEQQEEARKIWELLDGLPLALDQAGAYILETGCSFSSYQEDYTRRHRELLERRGDRYIGHKESVATTFSLAFEQVRKLNLAATDILRVSSFLSHETIPEEIFQQGAEYLGSSIAFEKDRWNLVLAVLQDYSLVQRHGDTKAFTMHRLVQEVMRDTMSTSVQEEWKKRLVLAVNAVFPHVEPSTWQLCERLLSHVLLVARYIQEDRIINEQAGRLLHETASYLLERSRYSEAELIFHQAISVRKKQLGMKHPDVAQSLHTLGNLYLNQSKFVRAERVYQRALAIREQQADSNSSLVGQSLNNLGNLYQAWGKYEKAESFYQRSLTTFEQHLGGTHPYVAYPLNGLGNLYRSLGRYTEAEQIFQRVLDIREQQLEPNHPLIAFPLFDLGILYCELEKYEQAEPLFQRALAIREEQLGYDHIDVAYPLFNLAELYRDQGKTDEAEPLYHRAHSIWEQQSGSNHDLVATSLGGLAKLYLQQGEYQEAEIHFKQAIALFKRHLGMKHPETIEAQHDFARLREAQGKRTQARDLFLRVLKVREQILGKHHPKTMDTRSHLISLLHAMGQHERAYEFESTQYEPEKSE
jgi:tetratricopeptide (TPR) repeat protein